MNEQEPFWIPDSDIVPVKRTGGSSKKEPRSDRVEHSRVLRQSFAKAFKTSISSPSSFPSPSPALIVVEMNDLFNRRIAANRREGELSSLGMEVKAVIDDKHILVAVRDQAVSGIESMIDQYGTASDPKATRNPSILDEIGGFYPNVGTTKCSDGVLDGNDTSENVILMVVPNMEERDYIEAFPAIESKVKSLGGQVNEISDDNVAMPYISATLPSESAVLSMCDDQAIYRVDSDEMASLDAFFLNSELSSNFIPCFDGIESKPIVCIIDGGFRDNMFLGPLVVDRYRPDAPAFGDHGAMVASRAAYGYIRPDINGRIIPKCRLIDANVYSKGLLETNLVEIIKDVVQRYHEMCKVYNLCINLPAKKVGAHSPLSVTIDDLQRSFDVTFVVSSGNVEGYVDKNSLKDVLNDDRYWLKTPSQSVYAITAGAIAHRESYESLSGINQVVPYSRHGPGISDTVKPDLLAYSANVDYYGGKKTFLCDDMSIVLNDEGPTHKAGTSFSAPVVSNCLVSIMDRYRGLRSRACCALMINSCEPVSQRKVSQNRVGFGSIIEENHLSQFPWRVTFVCEAEIGKDGNKIHRVILPVLECLRGKDCTITVTCLSDPELDASQNQAYILSRLSVTMQRKNEGSGDWEKIDERKKLSTEMDPCQMKIYKFSKMDGSELMLQIISTVNPIVESTEIRYTLAIAIEDDSRSVDVCKAVIDMNHYPTVSEALRERISDRQTIFV